MTPSPGAGAERNSEHGSASDRGPVTESKIRAALDADEVRTRREAALSAVEAAEDGLSQATANCLADAVRSDEDAEVRQFAVEALAVQGRCSDAIRSALDDESEWVRAEAVVALSRATPDAAATLRDVLETDESGWVRRNAVIALGKADAVSQRALVDRIKSDPHPPVREYAAQYLSAALDDVEEAERILAAILAREPNPFVRAKAAQSLGDVGTDRAEQALEAHGVTDPSDDVARAARRALATARGVDPDHLDVDVEDRGAPGGGPDTPTDRSGGRIGPADRGTAPGGAPGFDPTRDLEPNPEDRDHP